TPDVGGVWSRSRRYPGVTTQSPKTQYEFSDFPMPKDYPEWPTGAQVQQYVQSYADEFGLVPHLRLGTSVVSVAPSGPGWTVTTCPAGEEAEDVPGTTAHYDRVVVANGVFCEPSIPAFPGREDFEAAGGQVIAGSDFHDEEAARDRHALVVGYGKSACDVTVPISRVARSTDVIARQLLWKIPRRIAGLLNFKMLLLTRMGEALFRYRRLRGVEKFLHGPGDRLRRGLLNALGRVAVRQHRLSRHGLVPQGSMEEIVKGAIGLVTEGFFEAVADGAIRVRRDTTIAWLGAADGRPVAGLSDGTVLPADLIVCATGFTQGVPFLDEAVQERIFDERGTFMLYRQIQPIDVPGLYFNGYNSSLFSPLNAELAAVWIAADLAGALDLPMTSARRADVIAQIAFMDEATDMHHCRGTKIIPFSMHHADEVLADLGLQIGRFTRAVHWLNPVNPAAYRGVTPELLKRLSAHTAPLRAEGPPTTDSHEDGTPAHIQAPR
ncbi:flavin-containing monooxygenase, partial [Streptomyces sp. NPDC017991]|uniref:flavin-containing monooxygenase n=1 Tax=Streptomyces sp. NPDC017991 TaxID=3365026 RepID=UPI00378CDFF1